MASASVRAAVALVVYPGGDLFAAMRSLERGKLSLLGGVVEPGETPEQAATREAEEEGGVRVLRTRVLGAWLSDDGNVATGVLAVSWAGVELRGYPEGPAEWATREALLDPRRGAFPVWTAKLFAAYDAWLRLPSLSAEA